MRSYNRFNPLLALLTATFGTFTAGAGVGLTTLTGLVIFASPNFPSLSTTGLCSCDACACNGAGLAEEVEVDEDIDIEVGRDGRGLEGGADVLEGWGVVSRNSAGGSY